MYIFLIVCKVTNNQLYTQAKHIFMNVQTLYFYIFMNVQLLHLYIFMNVQTLYFYIFMNVQLLHLYIFMNVQTLLTVLLLPSSRFPPPLSVFLPHLRSLSVDCAP